MLAQKYKKVENKPSKFVLGQAKISLFVFKNRHIVHHSIRIFTCFHLYLT